MAGSTKRSRIHVAKRWQRVHCRRVVTGVIRHWSSQGLVRPQEKDCSIAVGGRPGAALLLPCLVETVPLAVAAIR